MLRVSPDGARLVDCTGSTVEVFSAPSLARVGSIAVQSGSQLAVTPDTRRAYVTALIDVVDLSSLQLLKKIAMPSGAIAVSIAISADGLTAVAGLDDRLGRARQRRQRARHGKSLFHNRESLIPHPRIPHHESHIPYP